MGKFTPYMKDHFAGLGCRLIARAYDKHRERRVTIHAVPGYYDCVGVSDGTDAWIAPASAGLFFGTATGDCADLMRRLQAGEPLPPISDFPHAKQPRVSLEDQDENTQPRPSRARLALQDDEELAPRPRRTREALT